MQFDYFKIVQPIRSFLNSVYFSLSSSTQLLSSTVNILTSASPGDTDSAKLHIAPYMHAQSQLSGRLSADIPIQYL